MAVSPCRTQVPWPHEGFRNKSLAPPAMYSYRDPALLRIAADAVQLYSLVPKSWLRLQPSDRLPPESPGRAPTRLHAEWRNTPPKLGEAHRLSAQLALQGRAFP